MLSSLVTKRKANDVDVGKPSSKVWIVHLTSNSSHHKVTAINDHDSSMRSAESLLNDLNNHVGNKFVNGASCVYDLSYESPISLKKNSSDEHENEINFRFLKKWCKDFPFLYYDEERDLIFCKVCRKFINDCGTRGRFCSKTKGFEMASVRLHMQSEMHLKCQEQSYAESAPDVSNEDSFQDGADDLLESASCSQTIPKKFSSNASQKAFQFSSQWLVEFPFLEYDVKKNVMFCKVCRKFTNDWRKTGAFVLGTNNFRASVIKCHQRSAMHAECQEIAEALVVQDSEAMEKDLYKDQLSHIFKSVYFLYKNKMPYTSFPNLCESLRKEGVDFPMYSNNIKACALFGKFIRMAFEKELSRKICSVSEFTLVCDGSFRRHVEGHDLVYIRFIDGLCVKTVFLGVIDSSAKLHKSVFESLSELFKKYEVYDWWTKVVYIMTDESDSHLWLEGLVDMIRNLSPEKFTSHVKYLPHKVRYCANIVQNHQSTSTLDALLWSIFCYYEKLSPSKKDLIHINKELKEVTEFYGKLTKNFPTSLYYESLKSLELDLAALIKLMTQENQSIDLKTHKFENRILNSITRSSLICKMAVVLDIFSCLNDFASKLGSEGLLSYDIHVLIEEVCLSVKNAAIGNGPMYIQVLKELNDSPGSFRGIEIRNDIENSACLPGLKMFGDDVVTYLKSLINGSLLEKSYIFNINLWPDGTELGTFGDADFVDVFLWLKGSENDVESALQEWKLFKDEVSATFPVEVRENPKSVIAKMVSEPHIEFPLVTAVLKKILLLNFETAEITRGYREMCLNKSHYRSVLSLESLQTMMIINMHGPSLGEVDFSLSYQLFLNSRHRKFRKKIIESKLNYLEND